MKRIASYLLFIVLGLLLFYSLHNSFRFITTDAGWYSDYDSSSSSDYSSSSSSYSSYDDASFDFDFDNCPSCGAKIKNIQSPNCEYCGAVLINNNEDFVLTNINKIN